MIALLMLQAALGALPRQTLPPSGCAAYLWTRAPTPQLVAAVAAEPASLRLVLDGQTLDLPRTGAEGATARGFAATGHYGAGAVTATLTLAVVDRPDLADGALVEEAMLTVMPAGKDVIVAPLGGLVGCASAGTPPASGGGRR